MAADAAAVAVTSENVRSPGAISLRSGWPSDTRVIVGLIPALRVRSRTSPVWLSSIIVTTVPAAPARAVRPERCR